MKKTAGFGGLFFWGPSGHGGMGVTAMHGSAPDIFDRPVFPESNPGPFPFPDGPDLTVQYAMTSQREHTPALPTVDDALLALKRMANPAKARLLSGFFKTGPGQYGEGDVFLGITMPRIRSLLPRFSAMPLVDIRILIQRPEHEARMLAVLLVVRRTHRADPALLEDLLSFYISVKKGINNWDLIDLSAPQVVGAALYKGSRALLTELSASKNMWDRRIAILATFYFIRQGEFEPTLKLATKYLDDPEDLMHKATGWMLREVGKRSEPTLRRFLEAHGNRLPRTALRYAIEHYSPAERKRWLEVTKHGSPARKKGRPTKSGK